MGTESCFSQPRVSAGTNITNLARASYKDDLGEFFNTISETVTFSVRAVASLIVTPDESEASEVVAANETLTKEFKVCNTSNISDSYTITKSSISSPSQITALYYDIDDNGEISSGDLPISLNSTRSPVIEVGKCIKVLALIETKNVAYNDRLTIGITARSSIPDAANGFAENDGTIINSTGKAVTFTDPNDPTLIPSKLVENKPTYISAKDKLWITSSLSAIMATCRRVML